MNTLAVLFHLDDFFKIIFIIIGSCLYLVYPIVIVIFAIKIIASLFCNEDIENKIFLFGDSLTKFSIAVVCQRVFLEMNDNYAKQDIYKDLNGNDISWPHTNAAYVPSFLFAFLIGAIFLFIFFLIRISSGKLTPYTILTCGLLFTGCVFGYIGYK